MLADSGAATPSIAPRAEALRTLRDPLLHVVAEEHGDRRRAARECRPRRKPMPVPRGSRAATRAGRPSSGTRRRSSSSRRRPALLEAEKDLGDREQSRHERDQVDAAISAEPEGEARLRRRRLEPDQRDQDSRPAPSPCRGQRRPDSEATARRSPSTMRPKYSGGPNRSALIARAPARRRSGRRCRTCRRRTSRWPRCRARRRRAALLRHLVAVETRDHRRRLARNAQQDRRGRAAVHRAVVDRREHDDRPSHGLRTLL